MTTQHSTWKQLLTAPLVGLAVLFAFAGVSNLDSLYMKSVSGDTYTLEITNSSGTDEVTVTAAGVNS